MHETTREEYHSAEREVDQIGLPALKTLVWPPRSIILSILSTALVFLVIVLGSALSADGGMGCPDWPTCFSVFSPPGEPSAYLEYLHRFASGLTLPLVVLTVWVARKDGITDKVFSWLTGGVFLLLIQIAAGVLPVISASKWSAGLHLGLALGVLSVLLVATTLLIYTVYHPGKNLNFAWSSPFARLTWLMLGLVLTLFLSGWLVTSLDATSACGGWPLCNGRLVPTSLLEGVNLFHRLMTGLAAFGMLYLLVQAWRTNRSIPGVLVSATAAAVLFFSQALMGAVNARLDYPAYLVTLHAVTSTAIWLTTFLLVVLTGLAARSAEAEAQEADLWALRKPLPMLRDLFMLTKPVVVLLLLVTTYAGMVIGAQSFPSFQLTFWTLIGGFLAAGGSGAINQYIDREDDRRMQRTSRRPIPAGRLLPAEGLAFGVGISLIAFYIMVAYTNFLAALLLLAGILYYVVLYSLLLKKTTVQNIVIGGGAGAIPPLVGWAAATGNLTFPSLLLFAVVFLWTPPHFWTLAIVRQKDYARAGVPMYPVVRGEAETRWQVFLYTLELVTLTLFLPLLGLGGGIYLVSALALGGMLLVNAYRVWKFQGNKIAWKMYRYSSMYLALLFLALMVDRLVY
jgi:protoheme IX farnesyltransferase